MVKKERLSLRDLKRTDEIDDKIIPSRLVTKMEETPGNDINVVGYEKLSVSIPLETFEMLQDISRERRRAKKKHTMSQIVREALSLWLEQRSQSNSI